MKVVAILFVCFGFAGRVWAQSTGFANLGFDLGRIIFDQNGLDGAAALPYWTVHGSENPIGFEIVRLFYDNIALDSWAVSIHDNGSIPFQLISGRFSVFIQSGREPSVPLPGIVYGSAAISQAALVPANASSLLFSAGPLVGPVELSMQTVVLPYYKLEDRGSYSVYGADIRDFAGKFSELEFKAPYGSYILLDDIKFSSQVVPEPPTSALFGLGAMVFGFAFYRRIRAT